MNGTPASDAARSLTAIRRAASDDSAAIEELLVFGFGHVGSLPPAHALPAGEIRFVGTRDERVVGFGAARSYGVAAYVGPLVVHPDFRRLRIASDLLAALARSLADAGVGTLLLDATEANAPLYRRFGFADIDATDVYERRVSEDLTPPRESVADDAFAHALAIDRRIAGCDREAVLARFAREPSAWLAHRAGGYLMTRGRALGPWLADDPATAAALLAAALVARPASDVAYAPRSNPSARAILGDAGFALDRSVCHLAFGRPSPMRRDCIYGQASLGHG